MDGKVDFQVSHWERDMMDWWTSDSEGESWDGRPRYELLRICLDQKSVCHLGTPSRLHTSLVLWYGQLEILRLEQTWLVPEE